MSKTQQRLQKLEDLKRHPWLYKLFKKIKKDELDFIVELLTCHTGHMDKDEFQSFVNRMAINNTKGFLTLKNKAVVFEILSHCAE